MQYIISPFVDWTILSAAIHHVIFAIVTTQFPLSYRRVAGIIASYFHALISATCATMFIVNNSTDQFNILTYDHPQMHIYAAITTGYMIIDLYHMYLLQRLSFTFIVHHIVTIASIMFSHYYSGLLVLMYGLQMEWVNPFIYNRELMQRESTAYQLNSICMIILFFTLRVIRPTYLAIDMAYEDAPLLVWVMNNLGHGFMVCLNYYWFLTYMKNKVKSTYAYKFFFEFTR